MSLDAIGLFLEATTLKRIPRMGWAMRGVPHVESVAEHSHAMTIVALALADLLNASGTLVIPLNLEKVLTIATLHDLAEARLTDLPASAQRLIPDAIKSYAEATAIRDLLNPLPSAERLAEWWHEFENGSTPEGRLVRDADKLEMMVQCLRYEQAGARSLDEFWSAMDRHAWHYPIAADLYARLRSMRSA
jgi:putative hydrolase of HD superfamily